MEFTRKWDYKNPIDIAVLAPKQVETKTGNTFTSYEGKDKVHDLKLQITKSKDGRFLILKAFPKLEDEEMQFEGTGTASEVDTGKDDIPF